jgi:signal transduction histidine kinase
MMSFVTVGTRLTMMLLLALTPVVAVYTYWSVQRSTSAYVSDLKREIRATTLGLAPALENDLREHEWDQIHDVLEQMSSGGTTGALVGFDGQLWYAPPSFPRELLLPPDKLDPSEANASVEFEQTVVGRHWFCRLVRLSARDRGTIGYLLVAQDWTDINEDLEARAVGSVIGAVLVVAVIAMIIPLLVRRYVSGPLAELSRKVMHFSNEEELDRSPGGDEVRLLSEEFRRLDEQLTRARTDLTAKHRRELELERRLQRADRLATIGTLASGLAHEIGTPMGVIRGRAEFVLRSKATLAKTQEGLAIIISQIDRISRIVRMLLDYARGHESLRVTCDVRPIVERALSLVETEAARRNVKLSMELGDNPLSVECDADQLQQVFVNLAMNALDAMTPKGGTFHVTAEIDDDVRSPCLKITFADDGPGVRLEHRARVFDPFFTTKEPGKGTGMGLAVSQSIMRDHNGEITLDAGPTRTRFFVTMPMAGSGASTDRETMSSSKGHM